RHALDLVMHDTQIGDLTGLQKRSDDVRKLVDDLGKQLAGWEDKLRKDIPQRLDELNTSSEELKRLRDAVNKLDSLFKTNDTAAALAGAFYRIDEFLGTLEVTLFVPKNVDQADLKAILDSAKDVKTEIALLQTGHDNSEQNLSWSGLTPSVEVTSIRAAKD